MNTSVPVPLLMRIPPPVLFALTFLAGIGLQRVIPLTVDSPSLVQGSHVAGVVLAGCGLLILLSCSRIFLKARTTVVPFRAASSLVTYGPYRFTRNPMYVSLVLIYISVAGILAQIWPLLLLPLPALILDRIVIPFEETRLREIFGDAYQQYFAKVRRWI